MTYFHFLLKLAPAIPIGAPTTLTEEITQTPPLVSLKKVVFTASFSDQSSLLYQFNKSLK